MEFRDRYGCFRRVASGRVHELYHDTLGDDILLVASDRALAFGRDSGVTVRDKGKITTAISAEMAHMAEEHWNSPTALIWATPPSMSPLNWERIHDLLDDPRGPATKRPIELEGRTTQMERLEMFDVICTVRKHITGTAWHSYAEGKREICGVPLKDGLAQDGELPKPIFTPKTLQGKDITFGEMSAIIGDQDDADEIYCSAMSMFANAYSFLLERGVILAEADFKLGLNKAGKVRFGGGILTPDSARLWDFDTFEPGKDPLAYGDQLIQDHLANRKAHYETSSVPAELKRETYKRYTDLYQKITGRPWLG